VAYFGRLYTPASSLAGVQVQIVSALAVFERIFDYLDMPVEGGQENADAIELPRVRGGIELKDVTFSLRPGPACASRTSAFAGRIRGRRWRSSAPRAPARRRSRTSVPRFYDTPSPARC